MNRRRLPLSEKNVRIERPCGVSIEQMQRLGRGRMHCASCGETVNVLWELSEAEARRVLRSGGCLFVEYNERGEVQLQDAVCAASASSGDANRPLWRLLHAGLMACVVSAPLWATGCVAESPRAEPSLSSAPSSVAQALELKAQNEPAQSADEASSGALAEGSAGASSGAVAQRASSGADVAQAQDAAPKEESCAESTAGGASAQAAKKQEQGKGKGGPRRTAGRPARPKMEQADVGKLPGW